MNLPDSKFIVAITELISTIGSNKITVLLMALLLFISYLYVDSKAREDKLNMELHNKDAEALKIERERTARLEFILNNLPKDEKKDTTSH